MWWAFMKKSIEINNAQIHLANMWWDFMKKSIEIMHKYIWQISGGIL